MIYNDSKRNHVIMPGREGELEKFLDSNFHGKKHKLKNANNSHSEDALTWSCFDAISQLPFSDKISALDEVLEDAYEGKCNFKFKDNYTEKQIEIFIGKTYGGYVLEEKTEVDASIELPDRLVFIEAKLYSSISLKDYAKDIPHDQIAKKLRVGLDYATKENKEFYFIFLDIAPRDKLYEFSNEEKSKENAESLPTKKWKSVWWFNRYKNGWKDSMRPIKEMLEDVNTSQSIESISENMGWLVWSDLFKTTMRGMIKSMK